jgi:hypothetical protein
MRLKSGNGYACDQCGTTHQEVFQYYSLDARRVELFNGRKPPLDALLRSPPIHSLDFCPTCFETVKTAIVGRPPQRGLYCEMTGVPLTSSFYFIVVSQVQVSFKGQPYKCLGCGKSSLTKEKVCACGGTKFSRDANMVVENRFVEFNVSEERFQAMVAKEEQVKLIAGQWTTTV